jgi:hypothetical protein
MSYIALLICRSVLSKWLSDLRKSDRNREFGRSPWEAGLKAGRRGICLAAPLPSNFSIELGAHDLTSLGSSVALSNGRVSRSERSQIRRPESKVDHLLWISLDSRISLSLASSMSRSLICSSKKASVKAFGWKNVIMNSAPRPFATTRAGTVQFA